MKEGELAGAVASAARDSPPTCSRPAATMTARAAATIQRRAMAASLTPRRFGKPNSSGADHPRGSRSSTSRSAHRARIPP